MPVISIMTAVLAGKHQYLRDSYESLVKQRMPAGWRWQWVVQEDGETGVPLDELPEDPRVSAGMGPRGRAATARTTALNRANGVLLRTLDADDLLPEDALYRDITTLVENPTIGWCVSPALDLLPDGSLLPGPRDPSPGPLPAGFMADGERVGLLPVIGTTLCTYTQLIRLLGGWPALTSEEDVALLVTVEAVSDGWMLDKPGLIYRKWAGQTTAGRNAEVAAPTSPQRVVLLSRADAIRAAGWRWMPPSVRNGRGRGNRRR